MKKAPLIISVVINALLIVAVIALFQYSRRTSFRMVADFTEAEVRLQKHFLAELESGDPARLKEVKTTLKRNIENGNKVATDWQNASQL